MIIDKKDVKILVVDDDKELADGLVESFELNPHTSDFRLWGNFFQRMSV